MIRASRSGFASEISIRESIVTLTTSICGFHISFGPLTNRLNVLDGVTDHEIQTSRLSCQTTTTMTDNIDQNHVYTQADILNAILNLKNRQYTSIRSAAKAYFINPKHRTVQCDKLRGCEEVV